MEIIEEIKQKPFTIEQYQRCLKAARQMSYVISDIRNQPISPELLQELFNSGSKFEKIMLEVVHDEAIESFKYYIKDRVFEINSRSIMFD